MIAIGSDDLLAVGRNPTDNFAWPGSAPKTRTNSAMKMQNYQAGDPED
jgi:hypothetical protein